MKTLLLCSSSLFRTVSHPGARDSYSCMAYYSVVSNLPAEIVHLLEEIEAKDKLAHESRTLISQRDVSIQKFGKQNGFNQHNPKEEAYSKQILSHFDKVQAIQDEKVALGDKARILVRPSLPYSQRPHLVLRISSWTVRSSAWIFKSRGSKVPA